MIEGQKNIRAHVFLLIVLWLMYTVPGLVGRDPWKADESYSFGLVYEMLHTGDCVVPTLAGEPFMEKPPIMYIVSAISARMLSPLLPLHDAARGSVFFFAALTFLSLGLAARELGQSERWWIAPVLLLGSVGLVHNQHMMITDVALLASFALAHAGFAISRRLPLLGGLILGTGVGVAFLSKGLLGPGLLGLTAIALPVLFKSWRTDKYLKTLLIAALSALPWIVIWPLLLYRRSPALFGEWFWTNNFGRFLGTSNLGPGREPFLYAKTMLTLGFPVFPLSVWSWWNERKMIGQSPLLQITLVSFMVAMVVLNIASDGRSLYAQPAFIPLCLASLPAAARLAGKPSRIASVSLLIAFALILAGGWLLWTMIMVGWPAAVRTLVLQKAPDYPAEFQPWAFAGGVAITAAAVFCWRRADRTGDALIIKWVTMVGMCYGLAMTLFLPIVNSNMSYKAMMTSLGSNLPSTYRCAASEGLGEPQRAMLHYYANLTTLRTEVEPSALDLCDVMIIQSSYNHNIIPARGSWKTVWEGRHGGRELFRLYFRLPEKTSKGKN